MSLLAGTLGKVAAVLAAGMVLTTVGLGAALTTGTLTTEPPSVESIENEWGEISAAESEIRTTVVVNNPNRVGVPGLAGVSYDVRMNDVTVARGSSGGLRLSPGRNEFTLSTGVDNRKIPVWWASHINNGEETTVAVEPNVGVGPLKQGLPAQKRTFSTDLLAAFESDSGQSVEVGNETLLTVAETDASWGEATANRTPRRFAGTVRNPNDAPITFSRIGYEVRMNDVTVAEGRTDGEVRIDANDTGTIRIDSALDNSKLDEWWVSHLRNGETTRLDVRAFAVMETDDGTRRVPLPFLSKSVVFETGILAGGQATTRAVETDSGVGFEPPAVSAMETDWRAADEGSTLSTRVVVDNPNGENSPLGEVPVNASYQVRLNDVTLVEDGEEAVLGPGRTELVFGSSVPDERIQRWWVSHVNNGEQTAMRVEAGVLADLGFASLPVPLPTDDRTFETDMLAEFGSAEQTVAIRGREVATLHDMETPWGEATMARTPMVIAGDVTNRRSRPLEIVELGYEVRLNDVVLADDAASVGATVPGGETRRIDATGYLDNSKMGEWWVGHLENGERSTLTVSYYAVVEYRGQRHRVSLEEMGYEQTVETDVFGGR